MEAMFLDYMMNIMRETVPKSDMDLESPATEIYRGMLDAENSQRAAKSGGVGIADQIIAYLESEKYTLPRGATTVGSHPRLNASPDIKSTGGTPHENQ
jgi:Rod binding domain-containing protein